MAVETNGTLAPPTGIDWLCVSPKAEAELVVREGDELKLVYPQEGGEPERFERLAFRPFLPAADGRPRARGQHRGGAALLSGAPALATQPADA